MRVMGGYVGQPDGLASTAYLLGWLLLAALLLVALAAKAVRVVPEDTRLVVFRFGRVVRVSGPGLVVVRPFVDRMVPVSLRASCHDLVGIDATTRDNVPVRVKLLVVESVRDPLRFVTSTDAPLSATTAVAEAVICQRVARRNAAEIPDLLCSLDEEDLLTHVNDMTERWGVRVSLMRITHVDVPLSAGVFGRSDALARPRRQEMTARGS